MNFVLIDLRLGQQRLHFKSRNHRDKANEEEHQRQEEADRPEKHRKIEDRRTVHPPRAGIEIAVQAHHDDHEALEPHADVDEHADKEDPAQAVTNLLPSEELQNKEIAYDQQPVHITVWAEHTVFHHEQLVGAAAVPSHKGFHRVAVGDDQSGRQHHLAAVANVTHRDEVFEVIVFADGNRQ